MSKADILQEIETLRHMLNRVQRDNAQILELSQELDRYIVLFYLIDRGV